MLAPATGKRQRRRSQRPTRTTARDDHQANKSEGVAAADPLAVLAAALADALAG
ncbi:MAG: hypothetical protein ACOX1P_15570 [Thermoguttaceae bacterium]